MKKYRLTIDHETYDVTVGDLRQSPLEVTVNGETILVTPEAAPASIAVPSAQPQSPAPAAPVPVAAAQADASAITAPIPGVVKDIAVKDGDSVTKGQELLVLEAMKMNNIIRSPRDGVIAAVHVQIGQQVQHRSLLVEFTDKGE